MNLLIGLVALSAWAFLLFGRAGFWRARDDDSDAATLPDPVAWPAVVAIVPARDEAVTIATTVRSLLAQDFPGELQVIVVDDRSTDGTGVIARAIGDARLTVLTGQPRPADWTGKLWALQQGLAAAPPAPLLLFTDADIEHAPDSLRRLVQRQQAGEHALVSLMARLACDTPTERWLIPAFVFFFQMLYPFARVRDPASRVAGAAGGCMLIARQALETSGGLAPIRGALIDDCALAARLKRHGPIWLGLTDRAISRRGYGTFGAIRAMVARTAYVQLGRRPWLLVGMVLAMGAVFVAPPWLLLVGEGVVPWLGAAAWGAMAVAFAPTLRRFGLSGWRSWSLPVIAVAYMAFTIDSAWSDWRGRGGLWKGEYGPLADRGT